MYISSHNNVFVISVCVLSLGRQEDQKLFNFVWPLSEILTNGNDEFDESGPNRQIKTNQYKTIAINATVFYFNLLYISIV